MYPKPGSSNTMQLPTEEIKKALPNKIEEDLPKTLMDLVKIYFPRRYVESKGINTEK